MVPGQNYFYFLFQFLLVILCHYFLLFSSVFVTSGAQSRCVNDTTTELCSMFSPMKVVFFAVEGKLHYHNCSLNLNFDISASYVILVISVKIEQHDQILLQKMDPTYCPDRLFAFSSSASMCS